MVLVVDSVEIVSVVVVGLSFAIAVFVGAESLVLVGSSFDAESVVVVGVASADESGSVDVVSIDVESMVVVKVSFVNVSVVVVDESV